MFCAVFFFDVFLLLEPFMRPIHEKKLSFECASDVSPSFFRFVDLL